MRSWRSLTLWDRSSARVRRSQRKVWLKECTCPRCQSLSPLLVQCPPIKGYRASFESVGCNLIFAVFCFGGSIYHLVSGDQVSVSWLNHGAFRLFFRSLSTFQRLLGGQFWWPKVAWSSWKQANANSRSCSRYPSGSIANFFLRYQALSPSRIATCDRAFCLLKS